MGCEVVCHVGQDHFVLEQGEDGVHLWFPVGVMPSVGVHGEHDADKVGDETVGKRVPVSLCCWQGSTVGKQLVGGEEVDGQEGKEESESNLV